MKICLMPHVIFQTTSQFFFKFCITSQCHEIKLLYTFLAQTFNNLVKTSPLKCNSFSDFLSFFIVMTHNSSVNFKFIHFLLWTKGSHQSLNFETSSALERIWGIPHLIFQTTSQIFFKFGITLQCHYR